MKYYRGKDGKFKGSIGDGKNKVPTASQRNTVVAPPLVDRRKPPHMVDIDSGPNWRIFVMPDGVLYQKFYDEDGRGIGKRKVGFITRLSYRSIIKENVERAWEIYDEDPEE